MARKIGAVEPDGISADELRGLLAKAQAEKSKSAEHTAEQSTILRTAIEQHGLDRTALTMTRRLAGFEEAKRQATLRAFLEYAAKMGFFDQTDAFDDIVDVVQKTVSGAKSAAPKNRAKLDAVARAIVA